MKIEHFESKESGKVSLVCQDPLFNQWNNLKQLMSKAVSIREWNILRGLAKLTYPIELINRLDASGFIVSLNLKNEK